MISTSRIVTARTLTAALQQWYRQDPPARTPDPSPEFDAAWTELMTEGEEPLLATGCWPDT